MIFKYLLFRHWHGVLQNNGYAYRTSIGVGVFLPAGCATLLITIATISFQAVGAAMTNPVKILKGE